MDNPMTSKTVECRLCGSPQQIVAPVSSFMAWHSGEYVQNAFPLLSAGDREMLISQTCDKCWKDMFGDDEDDFQENWTNN